MKSVHYFVIEDPLGVFHVARSATKGVVHGRFANRAQAHTHATQLRRDYLSPAYDVNGNRLSPRERARMGVWRPEEYAAALARGRKAKAKTMAVGA